jgi:hypothetical protein
MAKLNNKKPDLRQDRKLLFVIGVAAVLVIGLYIFIS